ncbi:MAG: sigma-70 family RNA polymerase sigma factor [Clostridia bacterium]|nr:sigma-70 family RNA polymerase sigma factor [Clostridia bacterium]
MQDVSQYAAEIFLKYEGNLRCFCRQKLYKTDFVDDCMQEAFTVLLEALLKGKQLENPGHWLARVVRNIVVDYNNGVEFSRSHILSYDAEHLDNRPDMATEFIYDPHVSEKRQQQIINKILNELPPKKRLLFTLVHEHHYTIKDAAALMEISYDAARAMVYRIKLDITKKVQQEMEPEL